MKLNENKVKQYRQTKYGNDFMNSRNQTLKKNPKVHLLSVLQCKEEQTCS